MSKLRQPFLFLIMNCKKYQSKADHQKKTWLPLIPESLPYYHVIGDETISDNFFFDDDKRVLTVKTKDDYIHLPNKVISAFQATEKTFDFDYVFKTDDDQMLKEPRFLETLMRVLERKIPKPHYGGHIIDVKQPYLCEYHRIHPELPPKIPILQTKYCNGRFYFLSKNAILDLLSKREKVAIEYLEDYAVGFHLDSQFKENMMHLKNEDCFHDFTTLL